MQYLLYRYKQRVGAWLLLGVFCPLMAQATEPETHYDHPVCVGNQRFNTEIADTLPKMQQGMMYRTRMTDDQAMLFIYPAPRNMRFWMKNTRIPLDMLFFDSKGVLQEIKHNVPPCQTENCPVYPAKAADNQFVLEIKGGLAKKQHIQVGDRLYGCES